MTEFVVPIAAGKAVREVMETAEAAEYLGIKPQTLASWRCTGRHSLPFVRLGRRIKYRKSDLDAYLAAHTVNAPAEAKGENDE